MEKLINQSTELRDLRAIFVAAGFDLWFVGGCVRDTLMGKEPKDIDLATSATPDEQVAIYEANAVRYIPTGLQHGTVTVVLDEPYEITSLRTEADHDGRYATMTYTRDLTEDLSRRDLTINAIALDFDGNVIDPFGGQADIMDQRVRFVGNAEERMREDYLRILRFFRFHARIAGAAPLCEEATAAIEKTRDGLEQISVERIWSEMQRIVVGPAACETVAAMRDLGLFPIIGMPDGMPSAMQIAAEAGIADPASVMGLYLTEPDLIEQLAARWKWANAERDRAVFVRENFRPREGETERRMKRAIVDGAPIEWACDVMRLSRKDPAVLTEWEVPVMPVSGRDLIEAGVKPGPQMGAILNAMKDRWVESDYTLTRDDLMVETVGE